jgi:hypothetical protein
MKYFLSIYKETYNHSEEWKKIQRKEITKEQYDDIFNKLNTYYIENCDKDCKEVESIEWPSDCITFYRFNYDSKDWFKIYLTKESFK